MTSADGLSTATGLAQIMFPRQAIAQAIRQAENPLAHRGIGEYVIDRVRGPLGHPAATTTGTKSAALARKRDNPVEAVVVAPKPREAAG
jgi:hypothetical protein